MSAVVMPAWSRQLHNVHDGGSWHRGKYSLCGRRLRQFVPAVNAGDPRTSVVLEVTDDPALVTCVRCRGKLVRESIVTLARPS